MGSNNCLKAASFMWKIEILKWHFNKSSPFSSKKVLLDLLDILNDLGVFSPNELRSKSNISNSSFNNNNKPDKYISIYYSNNHRSSVSILFGHNQ